VGEPVDIGVGETAATGDHICALYTGPAERDAILIPYICAALRSGDKCVCVIDSTEPADLLAEIGLGRDIDLTTCLASRQFDLLRAADTTMRSGSFRRADWLVYWRPGTAIQSCGAYTSHSGRTVSGKGVGRPRPWAWPSPTRRITRR
jgi:hypothetical protein